MTPAEQLAASKPVRKMPIKKNRCSRDCPFDCKLRDLREQLRLTLDDVCEAVGMSKAGYWELEHGGDPMLTTAMRLAAFYGKPIEEIWTRKSATSSTTQQVADATERLDMADCVAANRNAELAAR